MQTLTSDPSIAWQAPPVELLQSVTDIARAAEKGHLSASERTASSVCELERLTDRSSEQ